jgi:hypothetical protein
MAEQPGPRGAAPPGAAERDPARGRAIDDLDWHWTNVSDVRNAPVCMSCRKGLCVTFAWQHRDGRLLCRWCFGAAWLGMSA